MDLNVFKDRILVACEESQVVTAAFRMLGYEAFSCDLDSPSGEQTDWHLQGDVREFLSLPWGMIIAFPPCTDLCVSGARWFKDKMDNGAMADSVNFFMLFAEHPCELIAIENPVGIMSSVWRKPDQIIQPWQFGHGETKATCLWLKGLPKLEPTCEYITRDQKIKSLPPSAERSKLRSKTYPGIAAAMAMQWGTFFSEFRKEGAA